MIELTRISGKTIVLNSDLIEHIESNPDTVIKLTNGNKFVVKESIQEVVDKIMSFRGKVLTLSYRFEKQQDYDEIY
jgi:flagellar protein FlbD